MLNKPLLPQQSEWTFDLIEQYHQEIARIAKSFGLDTYPNQLEIITAEQMIDAYASVGMPVNYRHWSYGKEFIQTEQRYRKGYMGLAYEIVINSNPCISYLMEENTLTMQALVIAHAAYGHNSFFKGNYLFKMWTDASSIIDYLVFAKNFVLKCEQKYGEEEVEAVLDSCHALMSYGVDRYKRPSKLSLAQEQALYDERQEHARLQVNDLWRTLPAKKETADVKDSLRFPAEPQENILYFIEKNAPHLDSWRRELIRIVRKTSQYFYPQRQTQVMNEGWATFWHYTILNEMYDQKLIGDGMMLEWLASHTAVVYQPPVGHRAYSGLNPYALGFAMFQDIKRICMNPTDEDRAWFPDFAGNQDWLSTIKYAMQNFKDESFISQYLSPKIIRDFKLFSVHDDDAKDYVLIDAIHNENGYKKIREALSAQYNLGERDPNIQVWDVDVRKTRELTLRHFLKDRKFLQEASAKEVLKHVSRLWGFPVKMEEVDLDNKVTKIIRT